MPADTAPLDTDTCIWTFASERLASAQAFGQAHLLNVSINVWLGVHDCSTMANSANIRAVGEKG